MYRLPTDRVPPPEEKLTPEEFMRNRVLFLLYTIAWLAVFVWVGFFSGIPGIWKAAIMVVLVFGTPDLGIFDSYEDYEKDFRRRHEE